MMSTLEVNGFTEKSLEDSWLSYKTFICFHPLFKKRIMKFSNLNL